MAIPTDVFIQIGAYLLIVFAVIFIINRATASFLFVWLSVRRQRDYAVFVKVRTSISDYFVKGTVEEGWLIYRPRGKKKDEAKRLALNKGSVYRAFNILCVDVDDEKNCVVAKDFSLVAGYDAEKNNSLHLRALYKPSLMDDKTKIILIILVVIVLAVAASAYLNYSLISKLTAQVEALKTISQTVTSATPISGAV
jgi:hypothetical protein